MGFASRAIEQQKAFVAADLDLLAELFRHVNSPNCFSFRQWCHFSAMILEFRPVGLEFALTQRRGAVPTLCSGWSNAPF
jgi:hypothetical protein